jgi:hypothetical protein
VRPFDCCAEPRPLSCHVLKPFQIQMPCKREVVGLGDDVAL